MQILDIAPLAAAACAIPQFVPQLRKVTRTNDVGGVSFSWAALTSINNAAWTIYFALSTFWLALVPSISATVLAAGLAHTVSRTQRIGGRLAAVGTVWVLALLVGLTVGGREGLGILLSVAFVIQVVPAISTAYRSKTPTGIAAGTWLLVFGELTCWAAYGIHRGDQRLVLMGVSGMLAALLILLRVAVVRCQKPDCVTSAITPDVGHLVGKGN